LWSDRIQAVLGLAKGQLQRNRAEFEDWQAAVRRDAAEALAGPRAQMQRTLAALDARKPTDALAAISRQLEQNAAAQGVVQAALAKLSSEIKSKEDRVAQLESSAASARARMEELHGSGAKAAALPQQYADLSDESRKAEAEATALSNGTLEGAQMSYADDDGIKPAYSGGRQQPGLRDLKLRQAELRAQQDALKSRQTALTQQQEALNDMASKLDAQRAEVEKQAEGLSQRINEILAEADQHAEAAKKSQDEALKNFSAASKLAKSAVTAAKKRTTDAKNAMSGATPDERLQRITNDVDMEASMHCLSAELAYLAATIHASRIETIRADAATKSAVAAASGGAKAEPAEDEIDKLRTDAVDQLAEAQKSYEQAASLIGKSNVKLAEGSASGKNYLWQVQVGQAAVNMLQGVLLADKPEEATAAKEKAYKLLTDAAKGREQSPLLAPAIDALVQLQQSAR
jgi:DNA repair exonuclease SbcCD ATPase subunit